MASNDDLREGLTRRQTLELLGTGIGLSIVGLRLHAQTGPRFARGAVIRTLFKDVPPNAISGPVLFHEHLSIELPPNLNPRPANAPPPPPPQPPATDNVDLIVDEVKLAQKDGVVCIVDGGHPDMKRSMEALKTIATRTGILVVASGGYYMQRVYPAQLQSQSEDQIAEGLV